MSESSSSSSETAVDCNVGIELSRSVSQYPATGPQTAWRMRVEVSEYHNVDPNIFMYLRRPAPHASGVPRDTFESMATPADMEDYPAGSPEDGQDLPFFRLAFVDIVVRNRDLLDPIWENLQADRDELVRTLTSLCTDMATDAVSRFGTFADDGADDDEDESEGSVEPPAEPVEPEDNYCFVEVTKSNDPEFPVGSLFVPTDMGSGPEWLRTWVLESVTPGVTMTLQTSLASNTATVMMDDETVYAGGISSSYKLVVTYEKALGDERTIELEGVLCEASSSDQP